MAISARSQTTLTNLAQRAPRWVSALLLFAIAWLVAKLVWQLWPQPEVAAYQAGQSNTIAAAVIEPSDRGPNPRALAELNLFGDPAPKVQRAKPKPKLQQEARQTKLNLTLRGTLASDDPKAGFAIILDGKGKEKAYSVGDTIAGAADLYEVYSDRVLLDRNGNLEMLPLKRSEAKAQRGRSTAASRRSSSRSSRSSRRQQTASATNYQALREELVANPEKITEYVRVQPVPVQGDNGRFKGYRVYPGRKRELFRKAGFRSGDLVTAINGQSLEDPNQGISVLAALTTENRFDVTVTRRGQQQQLVVDLNQQ